MNTLTRIAAFLLISFPLAAQDGKIVEKVAFTVSDSVRIRLNPVVRREIDSVNFYRITYLSDGLKVKAFMAEPKSGRKLPCLIVNRGGNREFSKWTEYSVASVLGRYASWGYVVIASQYRGNDGGEGKEEFGGKDVHDVLNLLPLLNEIPKADTSRIGMEGTSRGGMMTYLAMKNTKRLKAAVVISGTADLFQNLSKRQQLEKNVFAELIPNYQQEKDKALRARSAVYWADEMCKTTPLLIMHGSADWRVSPTEAISLVQKLYDAKHPVRFIFFEGADHAINEYKTEVTQHVKKHFNHYLRDEKKWPSLEPHGF